MPIFAPLPDQLERDRFCSELETNYSVIAPAGVGKTTSIVARIVAIAKADAARLENPVLPTLVVVTYTKKAADEMLSRVRSELDQRQPHADVHAHLAQAFFGTIHSFCQRLLLLAGPLCGFPGEVEIATDTDRLWQRFCLEMGNAALPRLPEDFRKAFSIHGKWEDVFALAKEWPGRPIKEPMPGLPPRVNSAAILAVEAKGNGKKNTLLSQSRCQAWQALVNEQLKAQNPLPCPEPTRAGKAQEMVAAWTEAFAPLRRWRAEATRYLASSLAMNFAQFRRHSGQYTFDDLIEFASQLLENPGACALLRGRGWRVILDEAQDTDPQQFTILTEVTRPPNAEGSWIDGAINGPRPGAFCMVGDPQQSIYSDRADLGRYLAVHQRLLDDGGSKATFSVTMRCPVNVVSGLNKVFPRVLHSRDAASRQVDYVTLENPASARTGQMVRVELPAPDPEIERNTAPMLSAYVQTFARWMKNQTPQSLGTDSWSKVAILCPRKGWLEALGESLTLAELPIKQVSRSATRAGDPVYAWYAVLLTIFAQPRNSFELYGVLRDVFGFSDDSLVRFIHLHYERDEAHPLRIDRLDPRHEGEVADALAALNALYLEARSQPLYTAVEMILQQCQLAERLALVPGIEKASVASTLDNLRQQTAVAENKQQTLSQWAEEQRRALAQPTEEQESSEEAITLITAHKAKGLGFDVVILPFFFRRFGMPPERYPCFENAGNRTLRILFSGDDRDDSAKEWQETRRRELHERLLYVALTRVKRTLILLDDNAWWKDLKRQMGVSWAQLLKIDAPEEPNLKAWYELPKSLSPARDEMPRLAEASPAPPECVIDTVEGASGDGIFWRRVTPSSLQRHETTSERVEPDLSNDERFPEEVRELYRKDPAAYGNWWHAMMEKAPWDMEEAFVRMHFSNTFELCPDPNRGARELEAFLQSPLFVELLGKHWQVHTEVPFLFGDMSSKTGYEGFIDLLAVDETSGKWFIVDWKTDRMPGKDPLGALKYAYAPQLEIYDTALREAYGPDGQSCLYSTVTGEVLSLGPEQ